MLAFFLVQFQIYEKEEAVNCERYLNKELKSDHIGCNEIPILDSWLTKVMASSDYSHEL
jgi:hypothetical protein